MWLKGKGKLIYNPARPGIKKAQRHTPWWLIVSVDNEIGKYYRDWIDRVFHLKLQHPAWGTHITLLNDRDVVKPEFQQHWKKYHNQWIEFEYSVVLEQHWKFWTLPVKCERFIEIRHELGVLHDHPFHITIGRME